uniref:Uncharacterized protein n=1 Tax=Plectus sambesii TaxID=2011161 RepID=A0A914VEE5_9BILA
MHAFYLRQSCEREEVREKNCKLIAAEWSCCTCAFAIVERRLANKRRRRSPNIVDSRSCRPEESNALRFLATCNLLRFVLTFLATRLPHFALGHNATERLNSEGALDRRRRPLSDAILQRNSSTVHRALQPVTQCRCSATAPEACAH